MKKYALICALLLAFCSTTYANDNVPANLNATTESSVETSISNNTSSETNITFPEEKVQEISFISNEKASEICGEKFSTTFFNEQYKKLALLKRCELSLKTVPLAIWNLDKYVEQGVKL
ncbi:MAG: hypothetical protein IKW14_02370, partial [Phascolarctobacterium sp.]|nr:hypothetical protein [Phascolarctobacterium sp.]